MRPSRQEPTAVLAILAVLALGVLPAEHIHPARSHDGHHADVVHRHFEAHHRPGTQATLDDDVDDDHDVQWLTASFTSPDAARHVSPDRHLVEHDLSIPGPQPTSRALVQALFVSVHDPPWAIPIGLRAPPATRL